MQSQQHEKPNKPEQNFQIGLSLKDTLAKKIESGQQETTSSFLPKPQSDIGSHF